jgi:hypothetical protein
LEFENWITKFENLGTSNQTGYDWQTIREQNFSSGYDISLDLVTAQANTVVTVYQVVGLCGSKIIRTNSTFVVQSQAAVSETYIFYFLLSSTLKLK